MVHFTLQWNCSTDKKRLINESDELELLLIEYLLEVHRTERSVIWTT